MAENIQDKSNISTLDIKKFLFRLLAHWYLFVIFMAGGYMTVYFKNKFVIPQYSVRSTILITSKQSSTESMLGGLRLSGRKNLQNEMGVLKSHFLSKRAVEEMDILVSYYKKGKFVDKQIYKKAPFRMHIDTAHRQARFTPVHIQILSENEYKITGIGEEEIDKTMLFGEQYTSNRFSFYLELKENANVNRIKDDAYFCKIKNVNALTKSFSNRLKIDILNETSSILWLWIDGPVPEMDADYLNTLVDEYIEMGLKEKNEMAVNTINFIDRQLEGVVDSLTAAQDNLQEFRMENEVIDPDKSGGGLYEKLQEYEKEKNQYMMKVRYLDFLLEDVKQSKDMQAIVPPSSIGLENSSLKEAIKKLRELYQEREIKKYSIRKEDMPTIELLDYKITKAKGALIDNIKSSKKALLMNVQDIKDKIDQLSAELRKLPVKERKMRSITRKFNLNDNLYTYLLQKRAEAGITLASNKADVQVLDKAMAKNAVRRQINKTSPTMGVVLGFLIPLAFVVVRDYFNTTIEDRNDVEGHIKAPLLGAVGHNIKKTEIPVVEQPKSALAESFRGLRTNLQYMLFGKGHQVISVTSTIGGEGKTFCAMNMAAILAIANNRTLLVGLDMRKPRIHKNFDINNNYGMSNFLIGKFAIEEIIHKTYIDKMDIVPPGPLPPNPAELLESGNMASFMEYAREHYDYIVLDTPPAALVTDALLVSQISDANVFVIRQGYSNKNVLKLVNELYENPSVRNLSVLINDVKISTNYGVRYAYKYGYKHAYGYGYGSYGDYGYYTDSPHKSAGLWQRLKRIFRKNPGE